MQLNCVHLTERDKTDEVKSREKGRKRKQREKKKTKSARKRQEANLHEWERRLEEVDSHQPGGTTIVSTFLN